VYAQKYLVPDVEVVMLPAILAEVVPVIPDVSQPASPEAGELGGVVLAVSFTIHAITPTASVAVKEDMLKVNAEDVPGKVKAVIEGAVISITTL
jgi:hypothetical protein